MKKFLKNINGFSRAFKYCFKFALRNSKKDTIMVLIISVSSAFLSWFAIDTTGSFVTNAQYVINNKYQDEWLYHLFPSIVYLVGILIAFAVVETLSWLTFGNWARKLRFASEREVNIFKSSLDIASFKNKDYGEIYSRIQNSDEGFNVRQNFVLYARDFLLYFVKSIVFIVGLMMYSPYYVVVLLIPISLLGWNEYYFNSLAFKFNDEMSLMNRKRGVMERVFSRPTSFIQAKTYNQTKALLERINSKAKINLDKRNAFRNKSATFEIIIKIIFALVYTGVIISVFKNIIFGVFAIGMGFIIVLAMQQFKDAIENLVRSISMMFSYSKYVLVIEEEYFAIKPTLKTENAVVPVFDYIPQIEIKDVHFTYPNSEREILAGLNLTIEPNSKIMIVGESGCGKTTLMQLLLRHYDTTGGYISASGVNLKNIEPHDWFNTISAQMQEYEIFERKISHEIASSRFDEPVDVEKVKWAGEVACLDSVIAETKDGYDTQIGVGFGGQDFSGGENQRIAIARTIYRDTPILILDEPDAKLDPMNAAKLFDNVLKMKDKTVIVVSHKVSRAHLFDNIVVIKDGTIYEVGNHDELYTRKDHYYDLIQAEKSQKDGDIE